MTATQADVAGPVLLTCGPAWEPIDSVRRLTNHSTGRLGAELAAALARTGLPVLLLRGTSCSHPPPPGLGILPFDDAASLARRLEECAPLRPRAVLHAAAVSDFRVRGLCAPDGTPLPPGKTSSRAGPVHAVLEPAPKILPRLRHWFPAGFIVGWKFETDGAFPEAEAHARRQLEEAGSHACVLNGPAADPGFHWIEPARPPLPLPDPAALAAHIVSRLPPPPSHVQNSP
jgi:phosphopantothenate---cysteine ligase (CTP)